MRRELITGALAAAIAASAGLGLLGCGGARSTAATPAAAAGTAAGTGAGTAAPPLAADPAELAELADGLFDVLDAVAAAVEAHPADCAAMARDLDAVTARSAPIFARARQVRRDRATARALDAEMDRHADAARARVDRIGKGLAPCANDPAVRDAIDRLPM